MIDPGVIHYVDGQENHQKLRELRNAAVRGRVYIQYRSRRARLRPTRPFRKWTEGHVARAIRMLVQRGGQEVSDNVVQLPVKPSPWAGTLFPGEPWGGDEDA